MNTADKWSNLYPAVDRNEREARAQSIFRKAGGVLRTIQALRAGVHPRDLYGLRDAGRPAPRVAR